MRHRRARRPQALRGYHWAHSTWRYGTMPTPDLSDLTGFPRAWVTDYLDQYHSNGLCPDCRTFDNDAAADRIVHGAMTACLDEATHAACTDPDVTARPRQYQAALVMRLIVACEADIIAQEAAPEPWERVIAAHASACPALAADDADDAWAWRHAGR
ncbi:hypothetical protein LO763_22685 [Glycomyces sp. A-F 0318]|uniref:hypothetical protein n=1 Tax=Glycomyces amatae TaxID=2881355 RepID=UPI001E627E40|nr:hypothetical protein [Glycomyces amatae]MCD0446427.1 hypothetical protein [Glycomyces amatae]